MSEEVSEEMAGQDGAHLRPSAGPYICARYDVPPPRALRACVRACVPPNSNKGRSCVRVRVAQRMPALAQVAQLCELPCDA